MIKAVSFDLWDTVIHDDSDESRRSAQGLPSKRDARRETLWRALGGEAALARAEVELAWDVAEAAFNHVWHQQYVTWTVAERVDVALAGLGRTLDPDTRAATVHALEEMELQVMPDPVPGIADALAELATRYRLGVVSDAIYSPGRCLREWLDRHHLLEHFSAFAFSDEVGHSKPHRSMFDHVAAGLEVPLEHIVHVGDREANDIRGPHALGMRAILITATRDRDLAGNSADAICADARELPAIVDRLAAES